MLVVITTNNRAAEGESVLLMEKKEYEKIRKFFLTIRKGSYRLIFYKTERTK